MFTIFGRGCYIRSREKYRKGISLMEKKKCLGGKVLGTAKVKGPVEKIKPLDGIVVAIFDTFA